MGWSPLQELNPYSGVRSSVSYPLNERAIVMLVGKEGFEPPISCFQGRRGRPDSPTSRQLTLTLLANPRGIEPLSHRFGDEHDAIIPEACWGDQWDSNPCLRLHRASSSPLDDDHHRLERYVEFESTLSVWKTDVLPLNTNTAFLNGGTREN